MKKLLENLQKGVKDGNIPLIEKTVAKILNAHRKTLEETVQNNVKKTLFQ